MYIRMRESWHTYEWVIACLWMSHGTIGDSDCGCSCHVSWYIWSSHAHIWMSHGTQTIESWWKKLQKVRLWQLWMEESCHAYEWVMHTYEWVMAQQEAEECGCSNRFFDTCESVMSYIWMDHGTHMNALWHNNVMAHTWMSHATHESWHANHGTHVNESEYTHYGYMAQ